MPDLNLAEIKSKVHFGNLIHYLELVGKTNNNQWRGACTACKPDDPSTLTVNLENNVWHCHYAETDGYDALSLVAHIRGCTIREAAQELATYFSSGATVPQK